MKITGQTKEDTTYTTGWETDSIRKIGVTNTTNLLEPIVDYSILEPGDF